MNIGQRLKPYTRLSNLFVDEDWPKAYALLNQSHCSNWIRDSKCTDFGFFTLEFTSFDFRCPIFIDFEQIEKPDYIRL